MLPKLARAVSEPALKRSGTNTASLPNMPTAEVLRTHQNHLDPKTPRSQRGIVRRASKVGISMPMNLLKRAASQLILSSGSSPVTKTSRKKKSPSAKRVTFEGDSKDGQAYGRSPEAEREVALQRSAHLLDSLYELRRAQPMQESMGLEMTLMNATLADLEDESAAVRRTEAALVRQHEHVEEFGGERHATTLISKRTLAVVRRKADLLEAVEERLRLFQEAHARREDICDMLLNGDEDVPEEYIGAKRFVAKYMHKDGNPMEADKSNFDLFASTFGLSSNHQTLLNLADLCRQASDWWARRTLQEAQCGASSEAIQRLIRLVVAIAGDRSHPALAEVDEILSIRLAEGVLVSAKKTRDKDAATVARSAVPQPESAAESADSIKEAMRTAIAMGARPKHPAMEEAKAIEYSLRLQEKDRYAMRMLLIAKTAQAEDMKLAEEAAPSVAPVGPASDAADSIEKAILNSVQKDGVHEGHPLLQEARLIAKALRDEDGVRKRMAARERRLAKKAEQDGGA